jgi:hypothetical protein
VLVGLAVWLTAWPALAADPALVAALREAMQLAVERGIAAVGRPDGFLSNPAIRIPVPEPLTRIEAKLRQAGEDRPADKFVASLNRAAEIAAPAARPALLAAVLELPLEESHRTLARGDTSGTELLRRVSLPRVIASLTPVVGDAVDRGRVTRQYKRFVRDSPLGGLFQQAPIDLDAYVVGRTVDGLFHAIGEEERRIRLDPSARSTPRLREVFGGQR